MTKLQNQQQLNNQEWQRANTLADQETQFQQARNLAAQQSASTNAFLGSGLTGKSTGVGSASAKQGGGYNFTNANGGPTSAAGFAAANGIGIGDLLHRMGQSGDKYAQQAYNEISKNQSYYNAHPDVLKSEFAPLFWGQ